MIYVLEEHDRQQGKQAIDDFSKPKQDNGIILLEDDEIQETDTTETVNSGGSNKENGDEDDDKDEDYDNENEEDEEDEEDEEEEIQEFETETIEKHTTDTPKSASSDHKYDYWQHNLEVLTRELRKVSETPHHLNNHSNRY